MHPLEHPSPWVGRITLYLMAVLAIWLANRLTAGRKSPHAMTLVCWAAFSGGGLWTAYHFPAASYLFLIPLFAFLCGLVIDVLRRRARPGMLFSRWLGFALAAYMGVYHFQMLEVVANFQLSLIKVAPLILPLVAILPLLVRTGDAMTGWAPARLVGGLIVLGCLAQQFVPGYSVDRPRDMALLYMEFEGEFEGESAGGRESYLALESFSGDADGDFAGAHGFAAMELPWINGTTRRMPARPMPGLGLPGASLRYVGITPHEEGGLWRHSLELKPPPGAQDVRLLFGAAPAELQGDGPGIGTGIGQIRVDGMLAWDDRTGRKSDIAAGMVNLAYPGTATRRIEILAASPDELALTTSSRLPLPPSLLAPLEPFWPEDAEPAFLGHRAEVTAGLTGLEPEQ
jgi:hypothetical protein